MRDHAARTTTAIALLVAATLAVAGCSGGSTKKSGKDNARPAPQNTSPPGQGGSVDMVSLPDLVGRDLAAATAAAKSAGFTDIVYHDAHGKNRTPVADTSWKVCDQSPAPGPSNPREKVDFGAIPARENCTGLPTSSPPPVKSTVSPSRSTMPPSGRPSGPSIQPVPTTEGPDPRPTEQPTKRYYRNCAEAKAAGVAPLFRGQPGYGRHLDRDGDGVACEK